MDSVNIYRAFTSNPYNYTGKIAEKPKSIKQRHQKINMPALSASSAGTLIASFIIALRNKTSPLKMSYSLKEILFVGAGAILGGLAGGTAADKGKNFWPKIREANYQFITNLLVPTFLVDRFLKVAENCAIANKKIAKAIAVISGLALGIMSGSYITNKINNKVSNGNEEEFSRKVCFKDILLHVDDIPTALALSKVPHMEKILPFFFILSGYEAGKK